MPHKRVTAHTRDITRPSKENVKFGRWSVTVEGAHNENPAPIFEEALRRVLGLIESTTDASEIPMYGPPSDE